MRCFCISITAKEQRGRFVSLKERTPLHVESDVHTASLKRSLTPFRVTSGREQAADDIPYNEYRFGRLQ